MSIFGQLKIDWVVNLIYDSIYAIENLQQYFLFNFVFLLSLFLLFLFFHRSKQYDVFERNVSIVFIWI